MLIIERTFWFIQMGVIALIVAAIVLMVLRLIIIDAADMNPFGFPSRTIRRLTDAFVMPVRGALRGFGADPKFAPLVIILLTILLGFFLLQLVRTLAKTIAGLIISAQDGSAILALGFVLSGLLSIYTLLLFMRIVFSWGMVGYRNRFMRFLINVTEPLLGPLRRVIPPFGRMDVSPLFAYLILWLLQMAVDGVFLSGAQRLQI